MLEHPSTIMIMGAGRAPAAAPRPQRLRRAAALAAVAVSAIALIARNWLRVVLVEGSSMAPTYHDGDRLLALYARPWRPLRRGDVVVVRAPAAGWTAAAPLAAAHETLVKRVSALGGDPLPAGSGRVPSGAVYVEGDAPGGYDSTVFGPLRRSEVLGRVLLRLDSGARPA